MLNTLYFFGASTDPSLNLAPVVSWMLLGTIFSIFSGRPSCSALGTLESPVAWLTLPR
jgi:hypothetical protein